MPVRWCLKKKATRRLILAPRYEQDVGFGHECEDGSAAVPTRGPFYLTKGDAMKERRSGEAVVFVRITEVR